MYNVTRDMLIEILEGYIKLAKKIRWRVSCTK